jgi:hypothetical protein
MNLKKFTSLFKSSKNVLGEFLSSNSHFSLTEENGKKYLEIDNQASVEAIILLLSYLWTEKYEIAFHDTIHPTISDPGAYFSYSTEKSPDPNFWSMTYGNHGWSGGIYHISLSTLAKQISSLIKKTDMVSIQISDVVFFSHYKIESNVKSLKKDAEISSMHN